MGYTKRQFVLGALEELGLADYAFDIQPQQLEGAVRRLDAMMADWNAKGIRLGYPLPGSPEDTDIDDESQVPDAAYEAIICNLACKIAPSYGKALLPETKVNAKNAYQTLLARATLPKEMSLGSLPIGAGHKNLDDPYSSDADDTVGVGNDGELEF